MSIRIYLDTSVVSARMDDRLPERRRATVEFWERLAEYEDAISELINEVSILAGHPTIEIVAPPEV
jgi:hypothetical protein